MFPQGNQRGGSKKGKANNPKKQVKFVDKEASTPQQIRHHLESKQEQAHEQLRKFVENGLHVVQSQALSEHEVEDIKNLFLGEQPSNTNPLGVSEVKKGYISGCLAMLGCTEYFNGEKIQGLMHKFDSPDETHTYVQCEDLLRLNRRWKTWLQPLLRLFTHSKHATTTQKTFAEEACKMMQNAMAYLQMHSNQWCDTSGNGPVRRAASHSLPAEDPVARPETDWAPERLQQGCDDSEDGQEGNDGEDEGCGDDEDGLEGSAVGDEGMLHDCIEDLCCDDVEDGLEDGLEGGALGDEGMLHDCIEDPIAQEQEPEQQSMEITSVQDVVTTDETEEHIVFEVPKACGPGCFLKIAGQQDLYPLKEEVMHAGQRIQVRKSMGKLMQGMGAIVLLPSTASEEEPGAEVGQQQQPNQSAVLEQAAHGEQQQQQQQPNNGETQLGQSNNEEQQPAQQAATSEQEKELDQLLVPDFPSQLPTLAADAHPPEQAPPPTTVLEQEEEVGQSNNECQILLAQQEEEDRRANQQGTAGTEVGQSNNKEQHTRDEDGRSRQEREEDENNQENLIAQQGGERRANQQGEAGPEVAQSNDEAPLTLELEVGPELQGGKLPQWKATWETDVHAVSLRERPNLANMTDDQVSEVPSLSQHDVVGLMTSRRSG